MQDSDVVIVLVIVQKSGEASSGEVKFLVLRWAIMVAIVWCASFLKLLRYAKSLNFNQYTYLIGGFSCAFEAAMN